METIIVDKNLYSLKSILSTAYIFLDRFYIFLDKIDEDKISIQIKPKNIEQEETSIVDDFKNELINASLRVKISEDNKNIREVIVSAALYGVVERVQKQEVEKYKESTDFLEKISDPQNICKTWEETHKDEQEQIINSDCKSGILESRGKDGHKAVNRIFPREENKDCSKMFSKEKDGDKINKHA